MKKYKRKIERIQSKDFKVYKKMGIDLSEMDEYKKKDERIKFVPYTYSKTGVPKKTMCTVGVKIRKFNPKQRKLTKFQLDKIFKGI